MNPECSATPHAQQSDQHHTQAVETWRIHPTMPVKKRIICFRRQQIDDLDGSIVSGIEFLELQSLKASRIKPR
jgi:hypothetical protein